MRNSYFGRLLYLGSAFIFEFGNLKFSIIIINFEHILSYKTAFLLFCFYLRLFYQLISMKYNICFYFAFFSIIIFILLGFWGFVQDFVAPGDGHSL